MKVAFVSQHFDMVLPPDQSSVGIWTYEVSRRLAADCETTVIARRPRGNPSGSRSMACGSNSSPARRRCMGKSLPHVESRRPGAPLFAQSFYAFDYFAQALRSFSAWRNVVHLQNFPHYAPAIRRAVPNAAILLHMHCDWWRNSIVTSWRAASRHAISWPAVRSMSLDCARTVRKHADALCGPA